MKDLDFIKDKFEESGVSAPEQLNENLIKEKIENIPQKKSRINIIKISALAASLAVFTALAVIFSSVIGNFNRVPSSANVLPKNISGIERFKSKNDVVSAIKKIDKMEEELSRAEFYESDAQVLRNDLKAAAPPLSSDSSSSDSNTTYLQYNNVDEDDTVKTDGKYIFRVNSQKIDEYADYNEQVIDVYKADGKNSKIIKTLKPAKDRNFYQQISLYIHEKTLIAVSDIMVGVEDLENDDDYDRYSTLITTYDISDINNIKLKDTFTQSGMYISSRIIGEKLYLVTSHTPHTAKDLPKINFDAATDDEPKKENIPAKNIFSVKKASSNSFAVVSELDVNDFENKNTIAVMGCSSEIYCNENNLYLLSEDSLNEYGGLGKYISYRSVINKTRIVKLNLSDNIKITASALINGRVKDRYSLDEKNGMLRVSASEYKTFGRFKDNSLYILDENLKQKGKVKGFAKGEEIKAVRYEGDTAYVITYEETDPLFVIDLKNPSAPKILGSVKISGFSTMLVPVDKNTLLGIGYHTKNSRVDGLKLAVFDISNKLNPKVTDSKSYKYYYSAVQEEPKALIVNPNKKTYTLPFKLGPENFDVDEMDEIIKEFSGIISFKVENGKLKNPETVFSKKLKDVERCIYIGDNIYMFSESSKKIDCVKYKQ